MRPFLPLAAVALLAVGACRPASSTANFAWQGAVEEGAWVRVRNGSGRVEVRRSPDARVSIGAEVSTGGHQVTWVRDSSADGITFCVVFERHARDCDRAGRMPRSSPIARLAGLLSGNRGSTRTSVQYVLYVPAEARVDVRSVNGDVDLQSVAREFRAQTVNGGIHMVALTGGVAVETVNGNIDVALDLQGHEGAVSLETVNGNVTAELPAGVDGDVEMTTVNGRAQSEFELAAEGRRKLHGTLGDGGRRVQLKTVNGSVTLKRRG